MNAINAMFAVPWLIFYLLHNIHKPFSLSSPSNTDLQTFLLSHDNFKKDILPIVSKLSATSLHASATGSFSYSKSFQTTFKVILRFSNIQPSTLVTSNNLTYDSIKIPWFRNNQFWVYCGATLEKECSMTKLAIIKTTDTFDNAFEVYIAQPSTHFLTLLNKQLSLEKFAQHKDNLLTELFQLSLKNIGKTKAYCSLTRQAPTQNDPPIKAIRFPCIKMQTNFMDPFFNNINANFSDNENNYTISNASQKGIVCINNDELAITLTDYLTADVPNMCCDIKKFDNSSYYDDVEIKEKKDLLDEDITNNVVMKAQTQNPVDPICTFGADGQTPLIYGIALKGTILAVFLVPPSQWKLHKEKDLKKDIKFEDDDEETKGSY